MANVDTTRLSEPIGEEGGGGDGGWPAFGNHRRRNLRLESHRVGCIAHFQMGKVHTEWSLKLVYS